MGHMERNALMAHALQVVLDQGGDEDAVFAVVVRGLPEEDHEQAEMFAAMGLELFEGPRPRFGADAVRELAAWYAAKARQLQGPVRPRSSAWWRKRTA